MKKIRRNTLRKTCVCVDTRKLHTYVKQAWICAQAINVDSIFIFIVNCIYIQEKITIKFI